MTKTEYRYIVQENERDEREEIKTMTTYTEKDGITTKTEFTEFDAIGWSCLDASAIYHATVTEFSIARGVISVRTKVVNADGSDYKPAYYRNHWHGFTPA